MEENTTETKYYFSPHEQHKKPTPLKMKKLRRDKSDLGDDFVPPDGGYGWAVSIAAGANILVTFTIAHQFGIIFKSHMFKLGIKSSELTTIVSMKIAVSALTGLLNGPLFRRFTFRQVALTGSVITFIGIFLLAYANTFVTYLLSFSLLYGFGRGLTVSACSLAVNTYFRIRRRAATSYQYGVAGLGPILLPYFTTFLIREYDVQGTVLIFSAISLNTLACSLIYQPVLWHVKKPITNDAEATGRLATHIEEPETETEALAEPDISRLPPAKDGWIGSRPSLKKSISQRRSSDSHELQQLNPKDQALGKCRSASVSQSIPEVSDDNIERDEFNKKLWQASPPVQTSNIAKSKFEYDRKDEEHHKLSFYKKVIIFFDLDLLRDLGYVNIAIGLTMVVFVEINFAILTPFILDEFGYSDNEIAAGMSAIAFSDLAVRFLIPVITAKMHFSNKTFFAFGIIGMCLGRLLLVMTKNVYVMITIFVYLGINKALRTIFWSLIIPGYVPLKRLPAAAGLQLLMSGLFSIAFGPVIGMIRDKSSYKGALHFFNALNLSAMALWAIEAMYKKYKVRKNEKSSEK